MRALLLYARARGVPTAVAGTVALATAVVAADRWLGDNAGLIRPAQVTTTVLTALTAAVLMSATLGGADDDLERTTPFPWVRWRTVHLVLLGTATVALLGLAGREADVLGGASAVTRNAVGYAGIAAFAAACGGPRAGWAAPLTYAMVTYAVTPAEAGSVAGRVLAFALQPGSDPVAMRTALALAAVGLLGYAWRGARAG